MAACLLFAATASGSYNPQLREFYEECLVAGCVESHTCAPVRPQLEHLAFAELRMFYDGATSYTTSFTLRLIRFRGHLPKGGYDVQTDGRDL